MNEVTSANNRHIHKYFALCFQKYTPYMNIIIIIIVRHELSVDRPVSFWSNSLFKVFQVAFAHLVYDSALFLSILLLFILVTFFSQFDLYLLSILSNFRKFLLLVKKRAYPTVLLEKFRLDWCQSFLSLFLRVQISLPYKRMGTASALYTFILENFWPRVVLKSVVSNSQYLSKFSYFLLNIPYFSIDNARVIYTKKV